MRHDLYRFFSELFLHIFCQPAPCCIFDDLTQNQILAENWVRDSLDVSAEYSRPGANNDPYNEIGYGYQWWVPEGNQNEFMAIGVYGQWIYVNPSEQVIIVKTSADPNFTSKDYEPKHVEFFRAIADNIA